MNRDNETDSRDLGAVGAIYGVRLLEILQHMPNVEPHLVITKGGRSTIAYETDYMSDEVKAMARSVAYNNLSLDVAISSGSFRTDEMIIAPCSIRTFFGIANLCDENLIVMTASMVLKERRRWFSLCAELRFTSGIFASWRRLPNMERLSCPRCRISTISRKHSAMSSTELWVGRWISSGNRRKDFRMLERVYGEQRARGGIEFYFERDCRT
jgi:polyprenyl P-hydroxybenzoate/phenylacrylic acid decarboxylase-like protein